MWWGFIFNEDYHSFYYSMFTLEIIMYPRALMRGSPPSTTSTRLLRMDIPSHPRSRLSFLTFRGQNNRTRRKERRAHERAPFLNPAHPCNIALPPTSYLSPAMVSDMRASCHFAPPRTAGGTVPLCAQNIFSGNLENRSKFVLVLVLF